MKALTASSLNICLAGAACLLAAACGSSQPPPEAAPPAAPPPAASPQATAAPQGNSEPTSAPPKATAQPAPGASPPAATVAAPPPPPPRCPEGMVLVPGGEFKRPGAHKPKQIPDLCVDELETTSTQYKQCVDAGKCTADGLGCSAQSTYQVEGKENHPIVCIVFEQAKSYCDFREKRLPSIEEWEWAARGGEEGWTFPWGHSPPHDQLCWSGKERQKETCPVGTFASGQSKHGIFNMAGNVLEFATTELDDKSPVRIARGGAWNGGDEGLFRNGRIGGFRIDYRCGFLGVRCVHEAAPESAPASSQPAPAQPANTQGGQPAAPASTAAPAPSPSAAP